MWGALEDGALERVVVVSPHFDDAVLGTAHLLGSHPGSTVITVMGGRPGSYPDPPSEWDAAGGFVAGDDIVAVRREEDRAALATLGARSTWLDVVDGQYEPPDRRPSPAEVAALLEVALREAGPTAVFLPMGIAQPDHALTHAAGLRVRESLGSGPDAPLWFAYEDGGYVHLPGLLAWRISALFRRGLWPTPAIVPARVDMAAKRAAVACYASQVAPLEREHLLSERLVAEVPEQYWRIDPPPEGWESLTTLDDPDSAVSTLGGGAPVGPGTVALVTGASSGIGAATAEQLAARGAAVALVARRTDRLEEVAAACRAAGGGARVFAADLSDPEAAAELGLRVWDALGPVDILVNNAAVPMRRPADRLTLDEVTRVMTVNYLSPVALTLALLPRMLERGRGTIVNVSSLGGRLGIAHEAAYCASKFALAGWSESLAIDLAGTGLSVRLVLPGAVDTEIWDQPGNDPADYTGPLAPAGEVAAGVVDCVSDAHFEHYIPDMKAVVEMKNGDIDGFMSAMADMAAHRGGPSDGDAA